MKDRKKLRNCSRLKGINEPCVTSELDARPGKKILFHICYNRYYQNNWHHLNKESRLDNSIFIDINFLILLITLWLSKLFLF